MTAANQYLQVCLSFSGGVLVTLVAVFTFLGNNGNIEGGGEGEIFQPTEPAEKVEKRSEGCFEFPVTTLPGESGWENGLKAIPQPANCLVRGFPIEKLEPEFNYRRGYSFAHFKEVESRAHLYPYFLASHDLSLHTSRRKIYLDFGGNRFMTSFAWFIYNYPLDFTEYHVFEPFNKFQIPEKHPIEEEILKPIDSKSRVRSFRCPITNKILDSFNFYELLIANYDGTINTKAGPKTALNITRFIKEELNVTKDDALIVKMDIEGSEYPILNAWLEDPTMFDLIDELFLELHYNHESMYGFGGWNLPTLPTREVANNIFVNLRKKGFYVHPWP